MINTGNGFKDVLFWFSKQFEIGHPKDLDLEKWWKSAIQEISQHDLEFIIQPFSDQSMIVEENEALKKMKKIAQDRIVIFLIEYVNLTRPFFDHILTLTNRKL